MKIEILLKTALLLLVVALAVVITSWVTSEHSAALAQGGGGSATGQWMMATGEMQAGESVLYMFNTDKQVMLVYAYYRRAGITRGSNRYNGDLQFLAGRHCKWDMLYSQLRPYPYVLHRQKTRSDLDMPAEIMKAYQKASE